MTILKEALGSNTELSPVVIDIETINGTDEEIQAEIDNLSFRKNLKPETLARQKLEAIKKIRDSSALLDGAKISTISVSSKAGNVSFNWMNLKEGYIHEKTEGLIRTFQAKDEAEMLKDFSEWLDGLNPENHALIGWNIWGFDLTQLRMAYIRNKIRLPKAIAPHSEIQVYDAMHIYCKYFTTKMDKFAKLDTAVRKFGLASSGKVMSGAEAPKLYEQGKDLEENNEYHTDLVIYNALDSLLTKKIFEMMMAL